MVMGPRTSSVGVVLIDPPYDEIPADRTDNLYDEIHPRVSQLAGSTNQLDSGSSLDSTYTDNNTVDYGCNASHVYSPSEVLFSFSFLVYSVSCSVFM